MHVKLPIAVLGLLASLTGTTLSADNPGPYCPDPHHLDTSKLLQPKCKAKDDGCQFLHNIDSHFDRIDQAINSWSANYNRNATSPRKHKIVCGKAGTSLDCMWFKSGNLTYGEIYDV